MRTQCPGLNRVVDVLLPLETQESRLQSDPRRISWLRSELVIAMGAGLI